MKTVHNGSGSVAANSLASIFLVIAETMEKHGTFSWSTQHKNQLHLEVEGDYATTKQGN